MFVYPESRAGYDGEFDFFPTVLCQTVFAAMKYSELRPKYARWPSCPFLLTCANRNWNSATFYFSILDGDKFLLLSSDCGWEKGWGGDVAGHLLPAQIAASTASRPNFSSGVMQRLPDLRVPVTMLRPDPAWRPNAFLNSACVG